MPLIEINGEIHSVCPSQKKLRKSCWRKVAGVAAFFQLTFFLLVTLLLISAAVIQVCTGVAPYQYEILHAIRPGVLVSTLHRDIMEAHNFGIFSELEEEAAPTGKVLEGMSISTDLKRELEEADWGTLFTIYIFAAIITTIQCWKSAQLLRSSWKWINPARALELAKSWKASITSFCNYLVGFIVGTLLFASEVSALVVLIFVILWMTLCLISALANGYYKELSIAVSDRKDEHEEDI